MRKEITLLALLIVSTAANLRDYDVDSFTQMIEENLVKAANYVLPKDNEELTRVEDDSVFEDYGTFDFVIVGGGSAGSLLTRRLTEISHWKVLLLEAGGNETDFSDIPAMSPYLQASEMNWGYFSVPQTTCCLGMTNKSCVAPRGKVLGGSSVINAKQHARGSRHDFDLWAEMGNDGWSYREVLPYFKKTENMIPSGDPGYHSAGGLLSVSQFEPNSFTDMFFNGMKELGYKQTDYNGEDQFGYSMIQTDISPVGISSAGRSFIDNIKDRTNLNLTLHAFVTKVIIDSESKAEGVEFIKDGRKYKAWASKEVILSAGSINTPQILMLSGVGPAEELQRLDIGLVRDLPVGKFLQDHPMYPGLIVKTNMSLYDLSLRECSALYLQHRRPYTASFGTDTISFLKMNESSVLPDIQFNTVVPPSFSNQPGSALNFNSEISSALDPQFNKFTDLFIVVTLLHETSRGSVTLKSNNPKDFPLIDYNYFSDPLDEDIEMLHQGILRALELLETEAFKAVNATLINFLTECEIHPFSSRDYWYCAIRSIAMTLYHPVGTTRMGSSETDSVVSSQLKVHGIESLRVVDAGVFPEITSGNTNTPTYMVAENAADMIKKSYGVLKLKK